MCSLGPTAVVVVFQTQGRDAAVARVAPTRAKVSYANRSQGVRLRPFAPIRVARVCQYGRPRGRHDAPTGAGRTGFSRPPERLWV